MNRPIRRHEWQGRSDDGRVVYVDALALVDVAPKPATGPVPMWLRELRRDTREQVL